MVPVLTPHFDEVRKSEIFLWFYNLNFQNGLETLVLEGVGGGREIARSRFSSTKQICLARTSPKPLLLETHQLEQTSGYSMRKTFGTTHRTTHVMVSALGSF